jgi:hypothetical protein
MVCEVAADGLVFSWDTVSSAKTWDGTGSDLWYTVVPNILPTHGSPLSRNLRTDCR